MSIAFLIPSTSKGQNWTSFEDTFIYKILLNTFYKTKSNKFKYIFYFGFDDDDALYVSEKFLEDISIFFIKNEITCSITIFPSDCISKGHLTKMWNILFEKAYEDKCDYFFQCGDDIDFLTENWDEKCIQELMKNDNVGLTAPIDINNKALLTQTFVSRKHMEIFSFFFPEEIVNWYCDDWINGVYKKANKFYYMDGVFCENKGGSVRYDIIVCKELCDNLILRDYQKILMDKLGLVITTYNRPEYLEKCLNSLENCEFDNIETYIVIIDDNSTDKNTINMIKKFNPKGVKRLEKITKDINTGNFDSLKFGWDLLISMGCNILTNLDSDAIVKPNFLKTLVEKYKKYQPKLLTGYNSSYHTPICDINDDIIIKNKCGGINLLFNVDTYQNTIKKHLINKKFDWNICTDIGKVYVITPSVVQHIGLEGTHNGFSQQFCIDTSVDFCEHQKINKNLNEKVNIFDVLSERHNDNIINYNTDDIVNIINKFYDKDVLISFQNMDSKCKKYLGILIILNIFGGIYVDTDSVDVHIEKINNINTTTFFMNPNFKYSNKIIISPPHNSVLRNAIHFLLTNNTIEYFCEFCQDTFSPLDVAISTTYAYNDLCYYEIGFIKEGNIFKKDKCIGKLNI